MSSSQGDDATMDATLWGDLRNHIDLTAIFTKLPLHHFFRLRQVCKEWNRLAADPAFLLRTFTSPVPAPYFVVDSARTGHRLLTRANSSWAWTPLPRVKCESSGLVCEDSDSNRVLDIHSRIFHALPDASRARAPPLRVDEEEDYEEPLVGMAVDASAMPYAFRIILGDDVIGTRIYDSRVSLWTHKTSVRDDSGAPHGEFTRPTCAYCDGVLYLRVWREAGAFELHFYDERRDCWDCDVTTGIPDAAWLFCDVGAWRGRMYMVAMAWEGEVLGIVVWELRKHPLVYHRPSEDGWRMVDRMPEGLCSWMLAGATDDLHLSWTMLDVKSRFCGEYVLVYSCVGREVVTERAVLYNLESTTWEKVELPGFAA